MGQSQTKTFRKGERPAAKPLPLGFADEMLHPSGHDKDNANVGWARDWRVWPVYVFSVLGLRYVLDILTVESLSDGLGWTIIHLLHSAVRLSLFFPFTTSAFFVSIFLLSHSC